MNACWIGCGLAGEPSPSSVVTALPWTAAMLLVQDVRLAVHQDRARTALAKAASELGGGETDAAQPKIDRKRHADRAAAHDGGLIAFVVVHRALLASGRGKSERSNLVGWAKRRATYPARATRMGQPRAHASSETAWTAARVGTALLLALGKAMHAARAFAHPTRCTSGHATRRLLILKNRDRGRLA